MYALQLIETYDDSFKSAVSSPAVARSAAGAQRQAAAQAGLATPTTPGSQTLRSRSSAAPDRAAVLEEARRELIRSGALIPRPVRPYLEANRSVLDKAFCRRATHAPCTRPRWLTAKS